MVDMHLEVSKKYTYKNWGSGPHVFDVFFQALVESGMLNEARKLFDKLLRYGLVISVDSCNLFLHRLSSSFDGIEMAIKFFNEYPEVGVHWNTISYNITIHCLCRLGKIKEAHHLLLQSRIEHGGRLCQRLRASSEGPSGSDGVRGLCLLGTLIYTISS